METPVVLFTYKRTNSLRTILERIRSFQISTLYIFCDGPKNEKDIPFINNVRKIVHEKNWVKKTHIIQQNNNIGISNSLINGLNHVFKKHESAIILEDDCIPSASFYVYCNNLLKKYKHNKEIFHINGFSFVNEQEIKQDYFFTKFSIPSWGWATWKRAWEKFNPKMDTWSKNKSLLSIKIHQKNFSVWSYFLNDAFQSKNFWDISWNTDIWKNNGLCIAPNKSLISYVGFDEHATNTSLDKSMSVKNISQVLSFPLKHPEIIQISKIEYLYEDMLTQLIQTLKK